jgi:CheY-like chemotaxis protein
LRIIYVEDNAANLALVQRVARLGQHQVENFVSGEDALEKVVEAPPDLLLVDIQLAGLMNGLDLALALRERAVRVPMVAVTAYAMVGDRERCLDAGFQDYMPKPLPVSDLIVLFENFSSSSRPQQGV